MSDHRSQPSDCPERVAFELMQFIATHEKNIEVGKESAANPRRYFLDLYLECWNVVVGDPEDNDLDNVGP